MADDFKRAWPTRSQLRTCDCCHNTATNKQARAKLKAKDAAKFNADLIEYRRDEDDTCSVCGFYPMDLEHAINC